MHIYPKQQTAKQCKYFLYGILSEYCLISLSAPWEAAGKRITRQGAGAAVSECLFYSPQWSWLQRWMVESGRPGTPIPPEHIFPPNRQTLWPPPTQLCYYWRIITRRRGEGVDILTTQDRRILESQHCNIPAFQHPGGTSCQLPMLATNSAEPGEDKKYPCCQRRLFALPLHFSLNLYICA